MARGGFPRCIIWGRRHSRMRSLRRTTCHTRPGRARGIRLGMGTRGGQRRVDLLGRLRGGLARVGMERVRETIRHSITLTGRLHSRCSMRMCHIRCIRRMGIQECISIHQSTCTSFHRRGYRWRTTFLRCQIRLRLLMEEMDTKRQMCSHQSRQRLLSPGAGSNSPLFILKQGCRLVSRRTPDVCTVSHLQPHAKQYSRIHVACLRSH